LKEGIAKPQSRQIHVLSLPHFNIKLPAMVIRLFQLLAIAMIAIGATAFAQPRDIPSSREQVMLSYSPLVKQVSPAVVNIYTKRLVTTRINPFGGDPFFEQFFGRSFGGSLNRQQIESSLGTGVIVDAKGVLVTNAHVIKGAQEISVVLTDGREYDAELSLMDEQSDLAVLRIDTKGEKLPYARLNPSENLEVGDIVLAIGNPFGVGQTVTSGIVSALARSSLDINDFNFFIQTDAAINPGNSGGPLVAMDGSVVGINTAIYSRSGGSLGIGFAIPSEMVATVIAAEKSGADNASIMRPWLGISGQAVTSDIAESLGFDVPHGVLVSKIHAASPARKAGLKVGDVIISLNGRKIHDLAEMKFRLATVPIGEKADLKILRKDEEKTITVKAMGPPDNPPHNKETLEDAYLMTGAIIGNLNPRVAVELGLDSEREGVVVVSIEPNSSAGRLIRVGDIIVAANQNEVKDIGDLKKQLKKAEKQGVFDIVIERYGHQSRILIR